MDPQDQGLNSIPHLSVEHKSPIQKNNKFHHQAFRTVPKMEESSPSYKLYGNSLCKGKPILKVAL